MKFLCDACKTKYQIDDDKVAGKTVRMKCRKCEHLIEIRSPSASGAPSAPPSRRSPTVPPPPASSVPKAPLRAPVKPPGPARRPAPTRPLLAQSTGQFRAQNNPATPAPRPGVAPLQGRAPLAPRPLARPSQLTPVPDDEPITTTSNLSDALATSAAALDSLGETAAPAQWFVAIDGAPAGPLSIEDVRQRIAIGKVNGESLAWREGLGDWKKAAEIPELASLFGPRNGAKPHSGILPRTPLQAPEEEPATVMDAIPEELVRAARAALNEPPAPAPFMAEGFTPNADPFAPSPFVAPSSPFEVSAAATASGIGPGAFHVGAEPVTANAEMSAAAAAPHVGFASAGAAGPSVEEPLPNTPQKSTPWIPIAMLLTAVAFGITAAVVLFLPKQPQVKPEESKPATAAPSTPTPTPESSVPPPEPSAPVAEPDDANKVAVNTTRSSSGGSKSQNTAPAASGNGAADLSKLLNPGGGSGPSASNTSGGGGGGGGALNEQQIQRTVQSYMPGVKRGCWDSSNAQSGDVKAAITIAAGGSVQSVSTQSNDTALARCIETKVKGWKFPPPGGTQTVNVPFKFLRQ